MKLPNGNCKEREYKKMIAKNIDLLLWKIFYCVWSLNQKWKEWKNICKKNRSTRRLHLSEYFYNASFTAKIATELTTIINYFRSYKNSGNSQCFWNLRIIVMKKYFHRIADCIRVFNKIYFQELVSHLSKLSYNLRSRNWVHDIELEKC
jgi:hypothetical protein